LETGVQNSTGLQEKKSSQGKKKKEKKEEFYCFLWRYGLLTFVFLSSIKHEKMSPTKP